MLLHIFYKMFEPTIQVNCMKIYFYVLNNLNKEMFSDKKSFHNIVANTKHLHQVNQTKFHTVDVINTKSSERCNIKDPK